MTCDEFYQNYNGVLPHAARMGVLHGDEEKYAVRFLQTMHDNHVKRVADVLRSICVWRRYAEYPPEITAQMLRVLSTGIYAARTSARHVYDLLSIDSISAVMAAPISTT